MQRPIFNSCRFSTTGFCFILWAAIIFLSLFSAAWAWASPCATQGAGRTFMQLWRADARRTSSQWDQWYAHLDSLGFSEIIVQWSSYGPVSYYTDGGTGRENSLSLAALIQGARRHEKRIWLGLHYDPDFWSAVGTEPAGLAIYLDDRLAAMEQSLPDLLNTVETADPRGKVVVGWYVSDEIDDQNWQDPVRRQALVRYLAALRRMLRKAEKTWPVLISGFSNGKLPPAQLSAFWDALLQQTRIDGFLFQDGIGAGKLTIQALEPYLQSFSQTFASEDSIFGVVVELFVIEEPTASAPGFHAAAFDRVTRQLALARRFSSLPITVFSAPDYILPAADEPGEALYDAWRADSAACASPP
jgi:hypothetical protein